MLSFGGGHICTRPEAKYVKKCDNLHIACLNHATFVYGFKKLNRQIYVFSARF